MKKKIKNINEAGTTKESDIKRSQKKVIVENFT